MAVTAFTQLYYMLQLQKYGLDQQVASLYCQAFCADGLRRASRSNMFGFKSSQSAFFSCCNKKNGAQTLGI